MEIKLLNKSINQSLKTGLLSTIDSVLKGTITTTSLDIYTIILKDFCRFGEKKNKKRKTQRKKLQYVKLSQVKLHYMVLNTLYNMVEYSRF